MAIEVLERAESALDGALGTIENARLAVAECAEDAWTEFTSNDIVSSSLETIQEAADGAWETCCPALEQAGNVAREGACNGVYLGGRAALSVADVGEDAYIGIRSNMELIAGDHEAAVETAQIHLVDSAADAWGDFMQVDDQIREAGDYVQAGGEFATEIALGAVAMTASAPAFAAAGVTLVASEMGESLETNSEDGEISQEDVIEEVAIGTVAAAGITAGRGLNRLAQAKSAPEASAVRKVTEAESAADVHPAKMGGSYSELRKVSLEGEEVHHMPADSASFIERANGPAIRMSREDHRMTASCGSSFEARQYQAAQRELIEQGKFMDAIQMDVDDIVDKFEHKYDEGIEQMLAYAAEKGYI